MCFMQFPPLQRTTQLHITYLHHLSARSEQIFSCFLSSCTDRNLISIYFIYFLLYDPR